MADRIVPPEIVRQTIKLEELNFILDQAKDMVDDQTADAEKLYQRSVFLITFALTAVTYIIGYVGTHWDFNFITFLMGTIFLMLWVVISLLRPNMTPSDYWGPGSEPEVYLLNEKFFQDLEHGKTPEWYMRYSEVISYQQRIEENKISINNRAGNIKGAVTWLFWIPLVSIAVLAVSIIFGFV